MCICMPLRAGMVFHLCRRRVQPDVLRMAIPNLFSWSCRDLGLRAGVPFGFTRTATWRGFFQARGDGGCARHSASLSTVKGINALLARIRCPPGLPTRQRHISWGPRPRLARRSSPSLTNVKPLPSAAIVGAARPWVGIRLSRADEWSMGAARCQLLKMLRLNVRCERSKAAPVFFCRDSPHPLALKRGFLTKQIIIPHLQTRAAFNFRVALRLPMPCRRGPLVSPTKSRTFPEISAG